MHDLSEHQENVPESVTVAQENVPESAAEHQENVAKLAVVRHELCYNPSMKRIFSNQLHEWKSSGMIKPLLVLGARQVGKTYTIDEFCKREFKNYRQINLFESSTLQQIYESNISAAAKFEQMQMLVGFKLDNKDAVLFVDEIQESEDLISGLKYLQEQHPEANIICAGSLLGVKLKRMSKSFPVGKVTIKRLYPMSFQEFLQAVGKGAYIDTIRDCFAENSKMLTSLHEELLRLYRVFLCIGGMPEVVQQYLDVDQDLMSIGNSFFDDLTVAYVDDMKKYVHGLNEALKIERIYKSIPLQQANSAHKFQYSKVRSGARSSKYEEALDWLLASGIVYRSDAVSSAALPIRYYTEPDVFKLFLNDPGILANALGIAYGDIMLDRLGQAKGLLAESYVAGELSSLGLSLHYWRSEHTAEIDFLLPLAVASKGGAQDPEDHAIPIEVKSADNVRSKSLSVYREKFDPSYAIRISTKNFGFDGKVRSVPLYATFCLGSI